MNEYDLSGCCAACEDEHGRLRAEIKHLESQLAEAKRERLFPIQRSWSREPIEPYPMQIPWSVAMLAYSEYARRYGTQQSLERLAERGGFGPGEMDELLPDWRDQCSLIAVLKRDAERLDWCVRVRLRLHRRRGDC